MSIEIKRIIGRLPLFWDRNIIFFANIFSIFYENSGEIKTLKKQIEGVHTYGGRLVPILNLLFRKGGNLLVLENPPDKTLIQYFQKDLGLSLPEIAILSHHDYKTLLPNINRMSPDEIGPALALIHQHHAAYVDGVVSDKLLVKVAKALNKPTISSHEGSKRGNNKFLLHHYLSEEGYPVFDTRIADSIDDVPSCIASLRKEGYKSVVVKAQIGASGIGIVKLSANSYSANTVPGHYFLEGPCMVQGWLDETVADTRRLGSPSVQMFLDEESLSLYDITEQILSAESIHEGNVSPPPYFSNGDCVYEELLRQAAAAGSWLHSQGYRGTAGVDFHVVDRQGDVEVRICEINARVTGATYASVIVRHFMPHGAWLMRNIRFVKPLKDSDLLAKLDRAGYLYRPSLQDGVLPINFNLDEEGSIQKGQFLCLGTNLDDCLEMLEQIGSTLPVDYLYDRD